MKKLWGILICLVLLCACAGAMARDIVLTGDMEVDSLTGDSLSISGAYTLTVKNGIEVTDSLSIKDSTVVIQNGGLKVSSGSLTITNAKVESSNRNSDQDAVYASEKITISNSRVKANGSNGFGIKCSNGDIQIAGSTLDVYGKKTGIYSYKGSVLLKDSNVNAESPKTAVSAGSGGNVTISGGTVTVFGGDDADYEGIFAYLKVIIDGAKVKAYGNQGIGIFANKGIEINSNTKRVEATGATCAMRIPISGGGDISVGEGLNIALPANGKIGNAGLYYFVADGNGSPAKQVVIIPVGANVDDDDPDDPTSEPTPTPAVDNVTVGALKYSISGSTATVTGPKSKNAKKLTVPSTIKVSGKTYKVTAIKASAFKGMKKLTTVTLGANIKTIGKSAFQNCAKLKTITIKTKNLTSSSVKSNAFKGIDKKATFKCPKGKVVAYRKILLKKGAAKTCKFK